MILPHSTTTMREAHLAVFLLHFILLLGVSSSHGSAHEPLDPPGPCSTCPYFLPTASEVSTPVGIPANLTCGVRLLGDRKVSWIRKKDLHVLTTSNFTYTTDKRFRALHLPGSPFWSLQIDRPTVADSGLYECQVSTQPKIFRRFKLKVVVPIASITGTREIFMKAGSDINITCVVKGAIRGAPVTWYHVLPRQPKREGAEGGTEVVNAGGRGGVQLVTDKNGGSSWLLVNRATWRDAGNYTCAPAHAVPASVAVHVLDEETPAELHHDPLPSRGQARTPPTAPFLLSPLLCLLRGQGQRRGYGCLVMLAVCLSCFLLTHTTTTTRTPSRNSDITHSMHSTRKFTAISITSKNSCTSENFYSTYKFPARDIFTPVTSKNSATLQSIYWDNKFSTDNIITHIISGRTNYITKTVPITSSPHLL